MPTPIILEAVTADTPVPAIIVMDVKADIAKGADTELVIIVPIVNTPNAREEPILIDDDVSPTNVDTVDVPPEAVINPRDARADGTNADGIVDINPELV